MEIEERNKIYKQLEEQKGQKHQILVAIEEMSELTKELTKYLREDSYTNSKKICEEMADARVVLEQLDRFFDPEQNLVPFIMDYKLRRLEMFYLDKIECNFEDEDEATAKANIAKVFANAENKKEPIKNHHNESNVNDYLD